MQKDVIPDFAGLEDAGDAPVPLVNRGGRPRIELTEEMSRQAAAMARMHCTAEEIADVLGMSTDTLTQRLQERGYAGFPEFYKQFAAQGKASLRRLQWRAAEGGNVAAQIWLGKQWLGQRDFARTEITGSAAPLWPAQTAFSIEVMRVLEEKHGQLEGPDHDPVPDEGA
jgi:hypothetical protein